MRRSSFIFTVFFILSCAAPLSAMPGMGGSDNQEERFKEMDKNGDGSLSREEFFERFPQMHEAAFKSIDKNGDKLINLEEWLAFSSSHSRDMGATGMSGGMGGGPVMREMFKEDGAPAPGQEDSKGRPLFELKPKNEPQQ